MILTALPQITYLVFACGLILFGFGGALIYHLFLINAKKSAPAKKVALFEFLLNHTPVGLHLSTFDAKGKRTSLLINDVHEGITGVPISEADERDAYKSVTHPADYEKQKVLLTQLYQGEISTFTIEKRYIKKNGGIRWAQLTFYRNQLPDGGYQIAVTSIDQNKLKSIEIELKRQTEFNRMIIDYSPVGLSAVVSKGDGTSFRIANSAHDRITGISQDQLNDYTYYANATHPQDLKKQQVLYKKMLKGEIDHYNLEKRYIHKNGDIVWTDFSHRIKVLSDTNERIDITHIADITLLKHAIGQAEDALEEANRANRAKSEFLAMMSHEIRTPMNGVIGMTSVLKSMDLNSQQLDCVETISSSGESLLTIINDILDFSKIESGKVELEKQRFELRPCLENALDLLASKASDQNIDLLYQINDEVPSEVLGDPNRLRQVVVNLLGNAIKFTHEGHVLLVVSSEKSSLENEIDLTIAVEDTGIGISAEKIGSLFHPFVQADSSTTRLYGGTGLGLSISQKIVQIMGGEIVVTSEQGRGSVFKFTVPMISFPAQKKLHESSIKTRLENQRVLIVDDNPTNLKILNSWLTGWGMEVVDFTNPELVIKSLQTDDNFCAAILDMSMPNLTGEDLGKLIQENLGEKSFPLILLSSVDDLQKRIRKDIFQSILLKPTKPNQLKEVLIAAIWKENSLLQKKKPIPKFLQSSAKGEHSILVVEDNKVNQKVVSMMLKQLGYAADIASSGFEAMEAIKVQNYSLIFMDVIMPEMDGLETTQKIREFEKANDNSPIYIVALTANALRDDKEKCYVAGMDSYLSKPIQIESLKSEIDKLFGN